MVGRHSCSMAVRWAWAHVELHQGMTIATLRADVRAPGANVGVRSSRNRRAGACGAWAVVCGPDGISGKKPRFIPLGRGGHTVSEKARRTKTVFDAALALREDGTTTFRPGDITARLRADGAPFGAWEVRGELGNLERLGLVVLDEEAATWELVDGASFSIEEASTLRRCA